MTRNVYCLGTEKKKGFELGLSSLMVGVGFFVMFLFPGAIYMNGAGAGWSAVGVFICSIIMWETCSFRFMRYTSKVGNVVTIPSYFAMRFREKRIYLRLVSAIVLVCSSIFFAAFIISSMTKALSKVLEIDETLAMIGIVLVVVGELILSGFHSTYRLNQIRFYCLLITVVGGCLLIFCYMGTREIFTNIMRSWSAGSVSVYINAVYLKGKLLGTLDYVNLASLGMIVFGLPGFWSHYMGICSGKTMNSARRTVTAGMLLLFFFSCVYGGLLRAFLYPERFIDLKVAYGLLLDAVLKAFINRGVLGTIYSAVFLITVISCCLSILENCILQASTVIYEDLIVKSLLVGRERGNAVMNHRLVMILTTMLSGFIALMMSAKAYQVCVVLIVIQTSAIGIPLFVSLHWKKMNKLSCFMGMLAGIICPLVYLFLPLTHYEETAVTLYTFYKVSPVLVGIGMDLMILFLFGFGAKQREEEINQEFEDVKNRIV